MNYLLTSSGLEIIEGQSNPDFFITDKAFIELTVDQNSRDEFLLAIGCTAIVLGRVGVPDGDTFIRCDDEFKLTPNP